MLLIHEYTECDAIQVGVLIADTYSKYNLAFASPDQKQDFLGPFQHARSSEKSHQAAIADVIKATMVFVAELDGVIVGVLRGRRDKLQSFFVRGALHRQGIGPQLVNRFEQECAKLGARKILMSTLYAVPFYQAMGYKKSTSIRSMHSFEGEDLPYQPMKKTL